MRKIEPHHTLRDALHALDNGGRFYNLSARPADDLIEAAELARAAGAYSAGAIAFLYLEMALMALTPGEKAHVVSLLSPELAARYAASRPRRLEPSAADAAARAGEPAILSGYAVFVQDKTQLRNVVVKAGPVTVTPISDSFDLYEVFATPDLDSSRALVAVPRGSPDLDRTWNTFGGILKAYVYADKAGRRRGLYLEAVYHAPGKPGSG